MDELELKVRHGAGMLTNFFELELRVILSLMPDLSLSEADSPQLVQHKKALTCTLLDGLAALYLPSASSNRQRFQQFVGDFSGWNEATLVSVPVLFSRLQARGIPSPFVAALSSRLQRYSTDRGNSLPLSAFDVSEDILPTLGATKSEIKAARKCTHICLLYVYRSYLVHEFRPPGYAMESMCTFPDKPCYHAYLGESSWHLGYPLGFFESLTKQSISGFREYLIRERIDPYDRLRSAHEWGG
jgi:hypothetical protein